MNIFSLPDLGEGLPNAEIHEWFVKEGDSISQDQLLVTMETAKAIVEVPSPYSGVVLKLHGNPGDIMKTGQPLVSYTQPNATQGDYATVVGHLEQHDQDPDEFIIGSSMANTHRRIKATVAVRQLAQQLRIDLSTIQGSGEHGMITKQDVKIAANPKIDIPHDYESLHGARLAMLNTMVESHKDIPQAFIFEEADIHHWAAKEDITTRLIKALVFACQQEPALNTWFDSQLKARKCFDAVHVGLAMDTPQGLFVPVIQHAEQQSPEQLRHQINAYKEAAMQRHFTPAQLKGATIILSNFGKFSGRFASPIVVSPMVAILGVGKLYKGVVVNQDDQIVSHTLLPLSLSFDHRAVTGGEATRFLQALLESLQT